jgi:prophage regulatory protein
MGQKILRLPIVKERTGLSRSTIYLRMSHGAFPRQFSLGGGQAIGWLESDIEDWIAEQVGNKKGVLETEDSNSAAGDDAGAVLRA